MNLVMGFFIILTTSGAISTDNNVFKSLEECQKNNQLFTQAMAKDSRVATMYTDCIVIDKAVFKHPSTVEATN